MNNVYHHPAFSAKPVRRMGRMDLLQQEILRRAEARKAEGRAALAAMADDIIMRQAKAGTLNPAIVEALLEAVRRPHD